MFKKLNKKGFTLAELLVVAIIGVLVAVSIPIFTSQLEKAREATDVANLRAAKAVAATAYLSDENGLGSTQGTDPVTLEYNAAKGTLGTNGGDACGKGTATEGNATGTILFANPDTKDNYLPNTDAAGKKIQVTVTKDGTVTCKFVKAE